MVGLARQVIEMQKPHEPLPQESQAQSMSLSVPDTKNSLENSEKCCSNTSLQRVFLQLFMSGSSVVCLKCHYCEIKDKKRN